MPRAIVAALAFVLVSGAAHAQTPSPSALARDGIERRAIEAFPRRNSSQAACFGSRDDLEDSARM
jgi:hypothetical protein